jgi:hypothetical protein
MSFGIVKLAFGQTCILFDGRSIAEDASVWVVMGAAEQKSIAVLFIIFLPSDFICSVASMSLLF